MVADNNADTVYFMLGARRWAEPKGQPLTKGKKAKKHTNQNEAPGICRYRSFILLLAFHNNNNNNNNNIRPPGALELCPTGPVVFCSNASHSLPLFV